MRAGVATVSGMETIDPGRRPTRAMLTTSGEPGSGCSVWWCFRAMSAILRAGYQPPRPLVRVLPLCVVVYAGRRAQLMAGTVDQAQGGVEVLLELGELAVDVDVAFAAQPISLHVGGVDQPGRLGIGRLHDFGLGHQELLFFDAFLNGFLVGDVAVREEPGGFGLGPAGGGLE